MEKGRILTVRLTYLTVSAAKAGRTLTRKSLQSIHTRGPIPARVGLALVPVQFTVGSKPLWRAQALVSPGQV